MFASGALPRKKGRDNTGREKAYLERIKDRERQAELLHHIFGNPFHPITINPAWITPTVTALAQKIYDDRTFDQLPTLADSLVKSGRANQEILDHCRGPGPHVRGCWVVDLVLGKG